MTLPILKTLQFNVVENTENPAVTMRRFGDGSIEFTDKDGNVQRAHSNEEMAQELFALLRSKIDDAAYSANPVHFNGAGPTYLQYGSDFDNTVDGKKWTGSFWFRRTSTGLMRVYSSNGDGIDVLFKVDGVLEWLGELIGDSYILVVETTTTFTDTNWHHVAWSFDLETAAAECFVDGVEETLTITTFTDDTLDFTRTDHFVGIRRTLANPYDGDLADFQQWFGDTFADLGQASNLELFIQNGKPVDPTVAAAQLGTPDIILTGDTVTWHGDFTEVGTLTNGSGPVEL